MIGFLSKACLSYLPIQLRFTCPEEAPPIVGWAMPHKSVSKKMPYSPLARVGWKKVIQEPVLGTTKISQHVVERWERWSIRQRKQSQAVRAPWREVELESQRQ